MLCYSLERIVTQDETLSSRQFIKKPRGASELSGEVRHEFGE